MSRLRRSANDEPMLDMTLRSRRPLRRDPGASYCVALRRTHPANGSVNNFEPARAVATKRIAPHFSTYSAQATTTLTPPVVAVSLDRRIRSGRF